MILLFINEQYRKTKKGKKKNKTKHKNKRRKNKKRKANKLEMKLITPSLFPFHLERNINQSCDQQDVISLITSVC